MIGGHAVLVQPLTLDVVLRHRDEHSRIRPRELAADRESPDQRVIDAQLDLMLVLGDAVYRLDRLVALEPDREEVLAVERERVAHRQPAVGGERHVLAAPDVPALVADLVDLHDRPVVGTADRGAADLGGRGDVAAHQRRRDRQHVGVVVEAEAGHVAGQQRLAVDLQVQQVLHRVDVLQPVQPPRGDPPRVGIGRGGMVERRLESARERVDGLRGGPRPPLRRHLAAAQLADDLLQRLGVGVDLAHVEPVEHQSRGLEPLVVAGDAVAVEQLPRRGLGSLRLFGGRTCLRTRGGGVHQRLQAHRHGQSDQTRQTRSQHLRHGQFPQTRCAGRFAPLPAAREVTGIIARTRPHARLSRAQGRQTRPEPER